MIVRILGEGQYDLSDEAVSALNDLDAEVERAVEDGDDDDLPYGARLAARRRTHGRGRPRRRFARRPPT